LRISVVLTFKIPCLRHINFSFICHSAGHTEFNKHIFPADASRWTYDSLPVNFRNLWKAMLNFLHQKRVIPLLVEKLIHMSSSENESSHRRKMAAVWVKELSKSVDKGKKTTQLVQKWQREQHVNEEGKEHKVYKILKLKSKTKGKTNFTASHICKQMVKEVEKHNPHLKKVMSLRIQKLPSRFSKLQFLRDTIRKPNASTNIFLPRYVAHYFAFVLSLLLPVNNITASYRVEFLLLMHYVPQTEFHETTLLKAGLWYWYTKLPTETPTFLNL
jgi:hypothetical protein